MKQSRRHPLPAKKVRELLQDNQWVKDEDLTQQMATLFKRLPPSELVYKHSDGRILYAFHDGNGNLYPSSDDYVLVLQGIKEMAGRKPRHILAGHILSSEDFIQHIPELIDQLTILLEIPKDKLNKSMDSLLEVETKVRRLGRAKCIVAPIFSAVVAYMGEIIIAQIPDSHWQMRVSSQVPDVWEPWIIDPQGRICNSWSDLYDMVSEPEPITLQGAIISAIQGRAIPRSTTPISTLIGKLKK